MGFTLVVLAQSGSNLVSIFAQSNLAGKLIVLLLLFFSLLAWTVMIGKYLDLRRLANLNRSFSGQLSQAQAVLQADQHLTGARGPFADLTQAALAAYRRYAGGTTDARVGHVENALQRTVADTTMHYEGRMVWLGSIVTGAPFMGLLGTVWGVMDAFGGIAANAGGASIQNLAPGVAGALLTTVAALIVAIPSVFGYNFLLSRTRQMVTELENFASSLADRIELEARDDEEVEDE